MAEGGLLIPAITHGKGGMRRQLQMGWYEGGQGVYHGDLDTGSGYIKGQVMIACPFVLLDPPQCVVKYK